MAQPEILLYTAKVCPWAQRATLALEEVGAKWEPYEIDLQNKPSWYASKVNPASKVPVIQLGKGDDAPKIPESAVIVELVADLFQESHPILPKDPIKRAEIRYFVERYIQVINGPLQGAYATGDTSVTPKVLSGIEEIQGLLQKNPGKFYLGDEFTSAEIEVAPFVGRLYYLGKNGLAPANVVYEAFTTDPKYSVFKEYAENIISRPSFHKTFDEAYIVDKMRARLAKK